MELELLQLEDVNDEVLTRAAEEENELIERFGGIIFFGVEICISICTICMFYMVNQMEHVIETLEMLMNL